MGERTSASTQQWPHTHPHPPTPTHTHPHPPTHHPHTHTPTPHNTATHTTHTHTTHNTQVQRGTQIRSSTPQSTSSTHTPPAAHLHFAFRYICQCNMLKLFIFSSQLSVLLHSPHMRQSVVLHPRHDVPFQDQL